MKKFNGSVSQYDLGKADALNKINEPLLFMFAGAGGINFFRSYVEGFCSTPEGVELAAEIGINKDDYAGQTFKQSYIQNKQEYNGEVKEGLATDLVKKALEDNK